MKLKSEEQEKSPRGEMTRTSFYKDYKEVKMGLKFPYQVKRVTGPQVVQMKVSSIEINTGVSDDIFK